VDVDHFDWEPAVAAPRPIVMYAGRIAPGRRVRLLLEASALLLAEVDHEVWLVGPVDESLRAPLDEAKRALGIEDRVRETGPVEHDDMPRVIAQAQVCVVPAAADEAERPLASPPQKLLESMACRRPVVAPNRSCIAEIVRQGVEGLLFAPGDAQDLAACLRRLLTDPALAADVAWAGYHAVRERYPASASRRRLLEAYGRLLPADVYRPFSPAAAGPVDALPAHRDTTARHEPWVTERPSELAGRPEAAEAALEAGFQAAGSLLEGGVSDPIPGRSRTP
jgi:glycosyltransferase involved in cell wall biosynthesis